MRETRGRMSSQCNHFVQNAWKKELCSNCFKPREEHSGANENNPKKFSTTRPNTVTNKMRNLEAKPQVQGILKGKTSSNRKKKVAFPDSLTEVIGYGGDDFSDSEEFELSESLGVEDDLPDGEDERALCNLTRANTSFNTVTANLSSSTATETKKTFHSLLLGKPRKDSDGKKKTLLVSVTPFGGDANNSVPSAKRPTERKSPATFSNFSKSSGEVAVLSETNCKSDVTLKSINNISEDKTDKETHEDPVPEKILVDMPLITSSNLISVIQKSDSLALDAPKIERKIGISRTPAIKKQKESDKPKVSMFLQGNYKHTLNTKNEYIARTTSLVRETESYQRIEDSDTCAPVAGLESVFEGSFWGGARTKDANTKPETTTPFSREMVGEPDGKADEEMSEPPALPRSPPPLEARTARAQNGEKNLSEPRNSFLHNPEKKEKPAIPVKPTSLPPKGPSGPRNISAPIVRAKETRGEEETAKEAEDEDEDEEGDGEELVRSPNKRRAPKPPPAVYAPLDEVGGSLFARNPGAGNLKSDSPVVREKEKRERASSCSPKFRKEGETIEAPEQLMDSSSSPVSTFSSSSSPPLPPVPEPQPAPRRMISLSQDSLAIAEKIEEKKKARSRFSLKKFLRMGSKKDQVDGPVTNGLRIDDSTPISPQPGAKPRLEIIHPLELDGAAVEVVSRERVARITEDAKRDAMETEQAQNLSSLSTSPVHHPFARPGKPPPPPRNQSLDDWARLDPANKPARPPPPRTELKSPVKSWHPPPSPTSPTSPDSIYANLAAEDVPGEVRSALAPSKPQRTASMRDQTLCQPPVKKRPAAVVPGHQDYEPVVAPRSTCTPESSNVVSSDSHAYECLSSSPECDSSLDLRHAPASREGIFMQNGKRKSDSSALDPNADFKYSQQPFTRSTSLPYCGSETESELYSPYSFYTGDEGPEEDQDWKNVTKEHEPRVGRLRQRRGRSIVHRSLEDNYGAVVVANHEALAQVLEQLNQIPGVPPALRGLKTANLSLADFTLDQKRSLALGRRIFYSALWNDCSVTVCIALDLALHVSRKEFNLAPIAEFTDTIPDYIAEQLNCGGKKNVEATISVHPHLQVSTIAAFPESLKDTSDEGFIREASFVLLQLVNAFKSLQARGVEEAPKDLNNAVLCREDKEACHRLYLLQSLTSEAKGEWESEKASLCQCVLQALRDLMLSKKLPLIQELLERERTATLSQVKSVLEFSLWGPADITLGGPRDREISLQRWLDLERATVLHALVRARAPLAVTDEYHLLFLVRTSAKIMCEASMLLDAQRRK